MAGQPLGRHPQLPQHEDRLRPGIEREVQLVKGLRRVVAADRVGDAEVGLRLRSGRHRLPDVLGGNPVLSHRVERQPLDTRPQPDEVESRALHERR